MSDAVSILDALDRFSFSHAFLTTFSFDPVFFEDFCVDSLKGFKSNGNITVLIDGSTFDAQLQVPSEMPQKANLRYLLHPIRHTGIFHPKVFLLANSERARLIVGSGNLTRAGMSTNAELVNVYDVQFGIDEGLLPILQSAVDFLLRIADIHPSSALTSNFAALFRGCPALEAVDPRQDEVVPCVRFVHNLDEAMIDQVATAVGSNRPEAICGVTRYFDARPYVAERLRERFPGGKLELHTQNKVTNLTETWVDYVAGTKGMVALFTSEFRDDGHYRPLHAKLLIVRSIAEAVVLSGSANLTTPGFLRPAKSGNIEAGILWRGKLTASAARSLCDPTQTAMRLTSVADLQRVDEQEDEAGLLSRPDFWIDEAILRDEEIVVSVRAGVTLTKPRIELTFRDNRVEDLPTRAVTNVVLIATVGAGTTERLNQESAIVAVVDEGRTSNRLLVQNRQDLKTGGSLKKLRAILDAQRSARMFTSVLAEILASEDLSALLQFLNCCDIPLSDDARRLDLGRARARAGAAEAFAPAKPRDIATHEEVFPAAQSFIEKHHQRLRRHIESPSIKGVPNFLHICIAIFQVIRSQLEHLVYTLEHPASPGRVLSPWEWGDFRTLFDHYIRYARDVAATAGMEYMPALEAGYEKEAIFARLEPDQDELVAFKYFFLDLQRRVFACRVFPGANSGVPIFGSATGKDYLKPEYWPAIAVSVDKNLSTLILPKPAA